MRVFIAVDLPQTETQRLSRLCTGLPNARWTNPEQFHMTLRFIGEVDGLLFQDIMEVLGDIRWHPFSLQLHGIGFFPPRGKPRVIWAGIKKSVELLGLRSRIESRLRKIRLKPEGRKFAPHITIARLKKTPSIWVARFLEQHSMFTGNRFAIDRFHLYSSMLSSKGAIHNLEASYFSTGC